MRRFLKILLVKFDVTSPYQIRQNIVSWLFLLKDANLSSSVPAVGKFSEIEECEHMLQISGKFNRFWKALVIISDFTRNIFSLEFAAMQYEVLNLRGRRAHMVCFVLRFWAVLLSVFGQL